MGATACAIYNASLLPVVVWDAFTLIYFILSNSRDRMVQDVAGAGYGTRGLLSPLLS